MSFTLWFPIMAESPQPLAGYEGRVKRPLVSVIIPAYNEEACIEELCNQLVAQFNIQKETDFEVIIVENGSWDRTADLSLAQSRTDSRFKVLQLSRNFGCDNAFVAGLEYARGDACILMTADLQDPPETIGHFIARWRDGYDIVYGVVTSREGTSLMRRVNSRLYYWLIGRLTEFTIPANASDFRILDRKVVDAILKMPERNKFLRSMIAWMGFRSTGVDVARPPRFAGESKAYSLKVFTNALNSILQSSTLPITIMPSLGLVSIFTAVLLQVIFVVRWLSRGVPFPGFGIVVSLLLLGTGTVIFLLGIIAKYLWLVFEESRERPSYLVRNFIDEGRSGGAKW